MIFDMRGRHFLAANLAFCVGLLATQCVKFAQAQMAAAPKIPFVGCESDGQVGPLKAPKGKSIKLPIPAGIADRLAYYKAENGFGMLAPRGWYCFSTYGSNGSSLYVTPEPIKRTALFSPDWEGFLGEAVQVSVAIGDTSGRFAVAKTIARVFPDHKAFVQNVIAEGIEPASSFPVGPYPTDKIMHRGENVVEFETPPNAKGLGTDSRLRMNSSPIRGVAILFGEEPSLVHSSIRLAEQDLIAPIERQLEIEVGTVR